MKRILAVALSMLMIFGVCGAMAETATATEQPIEVPVVENGTVVPFADYNFQVTLPSDWNVLEVTQDQANAGIIYSCANPEGTRTFTIAYTEFQAATDMDTVATALAASYANVQRMTINDIPFVTYDIAENDVTGIITLGSSGMGMYQFVFYPASDEAYGPLALQIAASITAIQ